MEDVKLKLADGIAARLSGAPDSAAKAELIEELSDNLYSRYLEMTENGIAPDAAFQSAMDALGDTDELVDYLNGLAPDEPLPGPEEENTRGRVFINAGDIVFDLDDLLKNVNDIVKNAVDAAKGAVHQAKSAVRDAKDRMEQEGGFSYTSPHGRVNVNINTDAPKPPRSPRAPRAPGAPVDPEESDGYPIHAEGAWVERRSDDTYGVRSNLRAINEIDVEVGGDISIRMDETENDDVVIGGDIEDITVDVSAGGKLTIRQRARTASTGFFFNRGLSCADAELTLPRRRWESIRVSTVSGDVEVEGDEPVGTLSVQTVSGDMNGCVGWCEQLSVNTVNGDIEWRGGSGEAVLASVSGDVELEGHFESLRISSVSGDVEFTGDCGANHIKCSSMSGDIEIESDVLPLSMELSSKSGDIEARIPDSGPFSVQCKTMSGDITSDFFDGVISTRRFSFRYGEDGALDSAPVYRMETVSGDVSLERI